MTNHINLKNGFVMLDMLVFKDSDQYIAYLPALNISSHSKEQKTATQQADNAVKLFFDYWGKKGELHDKLLKLGWKPEEKTQKLTPRTELMSIPYTLIDKQYQRRKVKVKAVS